LGPGGLSSGILFSRHVQRSDSGSVDRECAIWQKRCLYMLQRNCWFVKFIMYANSVNGFDIRISNTTLH
jgi:hypothetical protein